MYLCVCVCVCVCVEKLSMLGTPIPRKNISQETGQRPARNKCCSDANKRNNAKILRKLIPAFPDNGYRGLFPREQSGRDMKSTIHLHLVSMSRISGLYLCPPPPPHTSPLRSA
jgi:hypothetical protein